MAVLNRKLFNRGGPVSSRGVGITSGLVKGYEHGGPVSEHTKMDNITSDTQAYFDLLKANTPERAPFDRRAANVEPLLTLFGNLMSGTSYQGGLGGALEIAGKGLKEAAPGFQRAINERRAYDAADPEAALRAQALGLAVKNQPDPVTEKWTGKEAFKANVNVAPVEEGGEGSTVVRNITRFTSNLGNVEFRDQNNNVITDFSPIEKYDSFEGPDKYQYQIIDGKAVKIPGQGAAIDDESIKTFQGKDGYQYLIQVDPNNPTKVGAVLLPGQETVENDPTLFKGPDGFTYILNASNQAEIVPGQGAADKDIKTFKGADGRTYILDEATRQAVLIPGQPEAEEDLEMFEGPNGIQYQVIDGEASKIPGQDKEKEEPKQPKTSLFQNDKFKTDDNPSGIVSAQFEYDEAKDKWRWTYEAADGKIKNMPMQGSIEIGVQGQFKDFESTVNTVKTDLLTRDVNTRKAISAIGNAINFVQDNPAANTITAGVAVFTNEVKAEINGALSILGKGKIDDPSVLNLGTYDSTFEELGIKSNVLKSKFLDLAYVVAAARGQKGRALSDKDIDRFIRIIGSGSADYKSVVATLTDLQKRLADEYAIEHNVFAEQYDNIDSIPSDYLLKPIGEYRDDTGGLVNPFDVQNDFSSIASELDSE
tara:strand:+ start:303 stop:2252 length:1950 start_codon:yes stop_codon:yes gene_type:complete